jgi:large subunit ribosomal protein L24e
MVVKRQCSFCAQEIEPGTGAMFVKRDGTVFHFCSGSCRKQQLHLHRVGHRFKWTRAHALKKAADRSSAAARAQAPTSPVRKGRNRSPTPSAVVQPVEPAPEVAPAPAAPAERTTDAKPAKPRTRARKKPDAAPPEA